MVDGMKSGRQCPNAVLVAMSTTRRRPTIPIPPSIPTSTQIISPLSAQLPDPVIDQRFRDRTATHKISGNDYSRLPPDELFSRFTVADIRIVQNKLR